MTRSGGFKRERDVVLREVKAGAMSLSSRRSGWWCGVLWKEGIVASL